jgi:hypothetical protein
MAMTPEEQAQFDEMKAQNEKLMKDLDEATKPNKKDDKKTDDETVLEAIRKKEKEDAELKDRENRISESAKFIATFKTTIDAADGFFPAEVNGILDAINKKKYDTELQRADDLRATIAESVFSVAKNLDLLTDIGKAKVEGYLNLSQSAKEKEAGAIWEYVLNAMDTYKRIAKAERIEQVRRGFANPTDAQSKYDAKIFGLRNKSDKKGE